MSTTATAPAGAPSRPDGALSSASRAQAFKEGNKLELSTLWRIVRMGFGYRWQMSIAILATVAAALFQLFIPHLLGDAVDRAHALLAGSAISASAALAALWTAAAYLVCFSVLRGLFTLLHNYFGEAIGHWIGYELRLAFYEKVQRLSFGFHDRVHTGELITRGMLDLEGVRMLINTGFIRMLLLSILVGAGCYLLLRADPVLGALSLSFVPFVAWRSAAARLKLRWMWLLLQERLAVLTRIMDENLGGIRVVRAFAAQDHELEKFDRKSEETLAVAIERVGIRVRNTTAMTFAFYAAMALVLWVGGLKVISGEITVGRLTEFLAYMMILQMPVRQIGLMVNSFARASTCGERLFEILDLEPAIRDRPDARALALDAGVLRFEAVDFAYGGPDGREKVLSDIGFTVGPGQTLGIVGPPGSGKSTIANLIPRFYDVTGGRITIDGQDIRSVTLESLRRAVGIVHQDPFLFTASIENNIAYGDPWADGERIARANRAAQLHEYVNRLPRGYGTLVGERGVSLSGGQRQRLSIARSLMTEPAVLIFDDSTAAIDAATERRIRAALDADSERRATVIISHRLSSLMDADEILFIEGGRIIERGTHETLIAAGGRYRDLYRLQIRPGEDHGVRVSGDGVPA